MRTCIFGGPRTGKSTKANELAAQRGVDLYRTDDLINVLAWSAASQHIADEWLERPGPWIVEGVAVGRALRKWLAANPEGMPCDEVRLLWRPYVDLSSGQASMAKGCVRVWAEVEPELLARGVRVVEL